MTRYVIAGGDELDSWVLTSTSDHDHPRCKLNLDGDDMLLEFLRSVIGKGGRVVIEIPRSASEHPERARVGHCPQPKRAQKK